MAKTCPSCSKENNDEASFCRECGASLEASFAAALPESAQTCPACDAAMAPEALFCRACGAERTARDRPKEAAHTMSPVLLIAAGVAAIVVVVAVVAAVFILATGDDGDTPATTGTDPTVGATDPGVLAGISDAVAAMPEASGDTDLEQMRSLLGAPDAFTVALEVDDDGAATRREEWFYYELRSVYEFVDGTLVSNLPIESENPFLILPIQYDPADFELGITWEQVAEMLGGGDGIESFTLEPEFELDVTVYAGNQLLLMFDEEGLLIYLEAIPLAPGEPG